MRYKNIELYTPKNVAQKSLTQTLTELQREITQNKNLTHGSQKLSDQSGKKKMNRKMEDLNHSIHKFD